MQTFKKRHLYSFSFKLTQQWNHLLFVHFKILPILLLPDPIYHINIQERDKGFTPFPLE